MKNYWLEQASLEKTEEKRFAVVKLVYKLINTPGSCGMHYRKTPPNYFPPAPDIEIKDMSLVSVFYSKELAELQAQDCRNNYEQEYLDFKAALKNREEYLLNFIENMDIPEPQKLEQGKFMEMFPSCNCFTKLPYLYFNKQIHKYADITSVKELKEGIREEYSHHYLPVVNHPEFKPPRVPTEHPRNYLQIFQVLEMKGI